MYEIYTVIQPVQLTAAVSRKTHGSAGSFDLNLPLAGSAVEPRGGTHTLVFTFSANVTAGSAKCHCRDRRRESGSPGFSGNTMTVNLSGVARCAEN